MRFYSTEYNLHVKGFSGIAAGWLVCSANETSNCRRVVFTYFRWILNISGLICLICEVLDHVEMQSSSELKTFSGPLSVCVRNKVQDWKFKVFLVEMYLYSPWLLKIWISLLRSIYLESNSALWWTRLKRCKSLNSYTFLYIFFSLYLESTYDLYGYDYGLWLWLWLILLI